MELARFSLGVAHPAPAICPLHAHGPEIAEIVYYEDGSGYVNTLPPGESDLARASVFRFQKGSVLIHPPLSLHDQHNRTLSHDHCLQLDARALPEHPARTLFIPRLGDARLRQEILALARVRTLLDPARQRIYDLRATALFCELCELARDRSATGTDTPSRLEQARRFLQENFDVIGNVAEVAGQYSFSPDYFRHLFAQAFGLPPKEYLLHLRLEHAQNLLRQTPLQQKEIAVLCGFGNIRYFNTRFRHYFGFPPGQLRNSKAGQDFAASPRNGV